MGSEGYEPGGAWGLCPRCGAKKRNRTFRLEKRTQLRVCPECFDPYPIQERLEGRPDRQAIPHPSPEPPPVYADLPYLTSKLGLPLTSIIEVILTKKAA